MTSTMFNDYEHVIVVMIRLNKYALISQQSSHYSSQDISTTYNYIEYKARPAIIAVEQSSIKGRHKFMIIK